MLRPACVAEFLCDSRVCGSNCCALGWGIAIDKEYYALYQRISNIRIRMRVLDAIEQREDGTYAIKKCEETDGACALLEPDGLCFLHKNFGEQYLSTTCALYPRVTYLMGNMASGSLTLTCPIAQKLLLLGKEPLRLERGQAPVARNVYWMVRPKMSDASFRLVQETAIALLQQRRYKLDERLTILGFFLDRVDEALGEGATEKELVTIAQFYRTPVAAGLLAHVPFDAAAHMRWIFGWMDEAKRHGWDALFWGRREGTQEASFNQVTDVYELRGENSLSRLKVLYAAYRAFYREKFLPAYGHILENYLVNEIFLTGFPCKWEGPVFLDWRLFVARWKLLEFFLIAWVKRCDGDIGEEEVLSLIECAERADNHFPLYTEAWNAYIQAGEQEPLLWMRQMLVCGER